MTIGTILPGEPQSQADQLTSLASAGKLNGVNTSILALIASWESGFETKGAGINSVGAGGYYGLKVGSHYPGMPTGATITAADLNTNSTAEFDYQSEVAAAEIKSLYNANGGSLLKAMNEYVTGYASPPGGNNAEALSVTNRFNAIGAPFDVGSSAIAPIGDVSPGAPYPTGNSAAGGVQAGVGPLTGPDGLLTGLLGAVPWTRLLLVIVAVILLGIGVDKLFDQSKSPGQILVESPGTTQRQAKTVRSKLGGGSGSSAPFAHVRQTAEEGAEAAAA